MCLSLSLFSDPVCMVVLMNEYSSTLLGVISATSRSNVCLFLFVPDSTSLHRLLPSSYIPSSFGFLLMHQSVS